MTLLVLDELDLPDPYTHYTVEHCDEVLRRRAVSGRVAGETTDAWLDARKEAQIRAKSRKKLEAA